MKELHPVLVDLIDSPLAELPIQDKTLNKFNFMYKVRQANPERFKTSQLDYEKYFTGGYDGHQSRPHSARSKVSQMSRKMGDRELYDSDKDPISSA